MTDITTRLRAPQAAPTAPDKRKHPADQYFDAAGVPYVREGKRLLIAARARLAELIGGAK